MDIKFSAFRLAAFSSQIFLTNCKCKEDAPRLTQISHPLVRIAHRMVKRGGAVAVRCHYSCTPGSTMV